jgi:predicted CXXCH cytochrome family protein
MAATIAVANPHECNFCHIMHSAPGPSLTLAADIEVLCLTCHGPAGTSTYKAAAHTNESPGPYDLFYMTCIDCHTPHSSEDNWLGGTNIRQVGYDVDGTEIARVITPNSGVREVVFESRGSDVGQPTLHSFADEDEDGNGIYDGICEVCHTQTTHHQNDGGGSSHYPGSTCVACHVHSSGFEVEQGNCLGCHSIAQDNGDNVPPGGRRAVIGEFALTSHHLHTTSVDIADCVACHKLNQHQSGYVRLKDVDTPSRIIVYENVGDEEEHCLSCHDADGAGGAAPFGDGIMPTVIDETAWSGAAHGASGIACHHCHLPNHGSTYPAILQAEYVMVESNPYASGDYAVCWICHNESLTIDGPNAFNDLHRTHVDGENAACRWCHDPHTPTEAGEPGLIDLEYGLQDGWDIQSIDGYTGADMFWIASGPEGPEATCYLSCHQRPHNPLGEPETEATTTDCTACHP